jgi:parallel beta-helix repeat protein
MHQFTLLSAMTAPVIFSARLLWAANSTPLPTLVVTHNDTVITQSCLVEVPSRMAIEDRDGSGALLIHADHITVRFKPGAVLRGAPPDKPWDQLTGVGIRIHGHRGVVIENAQVHGFKNGLVATAADGLVIDGGDFSDNYRQHLKSTPAAEDGSDWLFPHHNDDRKWRDEYGGAVCVESSTNVTIRDIRVRRGQNGIILDRVEASAIYDNDCSFLSGWGLALWRSSRNTISRNAFDFCVRGHSEGIYNRGQDSAGILFFEQCNDNVVAENSATHGGDCFFGFAGQEAIGERWMEGERERLRKETGRQDVDALIQVPVEFARQMSALGCNRNLLVGNDFSYAPAHGIEITFSEDNKLVRNRLVENAICGVWGGYSSGTLIIENDFGGNGGMAYGLERGGINMEHAADNLIVRNRFLNNKCAIHLWWNNNVGLMKLPGVAGTERGIRGNVIAGNRFEINLEVPFENLRPDAQLIVLQLRDSDRGHVTNNFYFNNQVKLTHPKAVEFAVQPGSEPRSTGQMPAVQIPIYKPLGKKHPVGRRKDLRGRNQIIMDDWGPWDHESPLMRPAKNVPNAVAYELFGLKQAPKIEIIEGHVTAAVQSGKVADPVRVVLRAQPGVTAYRARLSARDFQKELAGTIVATEWRAKFFAWKVDPRENLAAWRALADGPDAVTVTTSALDFPFGGGGPRDLKLSGELNQRGPGPDHFGLIARTDLKLPKGRWRFRTLSDDGVRVLVDGKPVIENWTWHGPTKNDGVFVQATEEVVPVVVEYFEIDGYATLQLQIEPAAVD